MENNDKAARDQELAQKHQVGLYNDQTNALSPTLEERFDELEKQVWHDRLNDIHLTPASITYTRAILIANCVLMGAVIVALWKVGMV